MKYLTKTLLLGVAVLFANAHGAIFGNTDQESPTRTAPAASTAATTVADTATASTAAAVAGTADGDRAAASAAALVARPTINPNWQELTEKWQKTGIPRYFYDGKLIEP